MKLRKGRGRPVERQQFRLVDESDRTHFALWSSSTVYPEKPSTHKHMGYRKFLNLKRLQLTVGGPDNRAAVAVFTGLRPARKILDKWEIEALHDALHRVYIYIYSKKLYASHSRRNSRIQKRLSKAHRAKRQKNPKVGKKWE